MFAEIKVTQCRLLVIEEKRKVLIGYLIVNMFAL